MTLWINELSFQNAKVVSSPDSIGLSVTPVHSSNFPEMQSIGVTDPGFEVELTVNSSDVNRILSQLRGSIRNREFTTVRSDTQYLRDNKQVVFIKVTNIRPQRTVGASYHTTITIGGKYVGTQNSHQPNFFINSVVIPNDWSKMGTTAVALPVGATLITEVSLTTIASHPYVAAPSWEATGAYSTGSVVRGTIGFNVNFSQMFDKAIRVYDGSGTASGYHITDLDEAITFSGGYATVHQDNWCQLLFNKTSGWVSIRPWDGAAYTEVLKVHPNSGQGFSEMYLLALNDNYIRLALDSEDEWEMFSCKLPSLLPGARNPYFSGASLYQGNVSGTGTGYNFVAVKNSPRASIGGNRYFNLQHNVDTNTVFKPVASGLTDVQYWFSWQSSDSNDNTKYLEMLRRLE